MFIVGFLHAFIRELHSTPVVDKTSDLGQERRKEMFLFNDTLSRFYLRLYGIGYIEIAQWVHHKGSIRRPIASRMDALQRSNCMSYSF